MKTKVLPLEKNDYQKSILEAVNILKDGRVVVFPTETVYGIGADINSKEGLEEIFKVKGRPADNPLIVHISNTGMLDSVVRNIPEKAKLLMDHFWPGPLTLVLPKNKDLNNLVTAGLDTVGVRMPDNPYAQSLIETLGSPIAAPSANISGKPSITSPKYLLDDFNGKVPALLIEQNSRIGIESTVIDMTKEPPVILRPGHISKSNIEEVIGEVTYSEGITTGMAPEKPASPGMKYKHYSPNAEVILVKSDLSKCKRLYFKRPLGKALFLSLGKTELDLDNIIIRPLSGVEELERDCYQLLREADNLGFDTVLIELPETNDQTIGLIDRLLHASNYTII